MISLSSLAGQNSSIETLIQQYMALERRPIYTLTNRKAALNTKIGVFNDVKAKLKVLENAADSLADTTDTSIFQSVQVTSSDTDKLTVTSGTNAAQGQYIFRIRQLATYTNMKSTAVLNTNPSTVSSNQIVAGSGNLDTDEVWADAGFDTEPDGTVTINDVVFTLADYTTVNDFFDAVIASAANANIYYDDSRDKIFLESTDGGNLVLSETGSNGFLTEVNISSGTHTTNVSGLESDASLYKINFDNGLSSSDSGSFKINGTTIEWNAGSDTLDSIISDINSSDAGVTAFYDDTLDQVLFTSKSTGSGLIEWEDVAGTFLQNTLKLSGVSQSAGQDALFTINSSDSSDEITKSSNTFIINGLSFTLKDITVANDDYSDADTTTVSVTSEKDESALRSTINTFLNSYNSVTDYIKTKTTVDITTYSRGALAGDTIFRALRSNIMGLMLGQITDLDEDKPSYLADIGITLDQNLHASITDSEALSDWLDEDPEAVSNLFNSANGVAAQMVSLLAPYTESYGIIEDRTDGFTDQIESVDVRIERLEKRLERKESYYRNQFSALQESLSIVR